MHSSLAAKNHRRSTPASRLQRLVDRLARIAFIVLLGAIVVGLVGGIMTALMISPDIEQEAAPAYECLEPPCFDLNLSGITLNDTPNVVWLVGSVLAILLGVPSLIMSLWDVLRRKWEDLGRHLLTFIGPLLVFMGTEIIPHILLPCAVLPSVCEDLPEHGLNVTQQWHQLDHMLVGAVPLVLLYGLALRRWHPAIIPFPKLLRRHNGERATEK